MSVWYEITVTGSESAVRAFVAACAAGAGGREMAEFGRDLDLEEGRFSQRVRELLSKGSHHLVFAPADLALDLAAALRRGGRDAGLELEGMSEVVRARVRFSAAAFSRELAARIRTELLAGLPPGVEGEDIEEREEQDPEAREVELYTPEHEYVYRASGAFSGPFPGVLELRRRALELPFVKLRAVELETRPAGPPGSANG
jgi:hypothetical protein